MLEAREAAGLTQMQVRERLGMSQGTLSGLERDALSTKRLVDFATLYGVNPVWLATGRGPRTGRLQHLSQVAPPVTEGVEPGLLGGVVAHGLSLSEETVEPPVLEWGDVMTGRLPAEFKLRIDDDAMSPEFPPGTLVTFSTEAGEPRALDGVLVCDQDRNVYFREYRIKRPGHWQAAPLNAGYDALDSIEHGLSVMAIMISYVKMGRRSA